MIHQLKDGQGRDRFDPIPPREIDISDVYSVLYQLGLTARYTGFFYTAYAVYLAVEMPQRLLLVTKWLYPEVAIHYGTHAGCVERDIRTVIAMVWERGRGCLEWIAGRHIHEQPCVSEFVGIIVFYLQTATPGPSAA